MVGIIVTNQWKSVSIFTHQLRLPGVTHKECPLVSLVGDFPSSTQSTYAHGQVRDRPHLVEGVTVQKTSLGHCMRCGLCDFVQRS